MLGFMGFSIWQLDKDEIINIPSMFRIVVYGAIYVYAFLPMVSGVCFIAPAIMKKDGENNNSFKRICTKNPVYWVFPL